MIRIVHKILLLIASLRLVPLALYAMFTGNALVRKDFEQWKKVLIVSDLPKGRFGQIMRYLTELPEFRSLLYYRMGNKSMLISWMAAGQPALYIRCEKVGPGLVLQHGHSTRIGANSVGENCQIWHNVTIGKRRPGEKNKPTIGRNVKICAGAIVLGDITIGDNAVIGAGAVVLHDVPADCMAVGNPARILPLKR